MWRNLFHLIVVLLIATGLAFVAAPFFAFRALKANARDGDVQGLAELVDYPAVRASLKTQLGDAPPESAGPAPSLWSDPFGAMRRAIEPLRPTPPAVDRYVSLDGMRALTRGYEPGAAPALLQGGGSGLKVRYWGPNRARFVASPTGDAEGVVFTFQRRGPFTWKLVGVGLPAQRPPAGP